MPIAGVDLYWTVLPVAVRRLDLIVCSTAPTLSRDSTNTAIHQ